MKSKDCMYLKAFIRTSLSIVCVALASTIGFMGCAPKRVLLPERLPMEVIPADRIPEFNRITVCQGPAKVYYRAKVFDCVVRCFDSNNDGSMLDRLNPGIDVYEYEALLIGSDTKGTAVSHLLLALLIDADFDGDADYLYNARLVTGNKIETYEKIWIHSLSLSMKDINPAVLKVFEYKYSFSQYSNGSAPPPDR